MQRGQDHRHGRGGGRGGGNRGRGSWSGNRGGRGRSHQPQPRTNSGAGPDESSIPPEYLNRVRTVGTSPEDVARWRAERKSRFPRSFTTKQEQELQQPQLGLQIVGVEETESSKRLKAVASHFAAYGSDDEDEEKAVIQVEEEGNQDAATMENAVSTKDANTISANEVQSNTQAMEAVTSDGSGPMVCTHFSRFGTCKFGNRCRFVHSAPALPTGEDERNPRTKKPRGSTGTFKLRTQAELMDALVADEIERKHAVLLQCLAFIVASDFFEE